MAAEDRIKKAGDAVATLQGQLTAVEEVLDTAEEIVVKAKKARPCARRLFRLLLLIVIVAAVVAIVKKLMGSNSSDDEVVLVAAGTAEDVAEDATAPEDPASESEGEDA